MPEVRTGHGDAPRELTDEVLASLALHDKGTEDRRFLDRLPLIETAAGDSRNFVRKGVGWAMRAICKRSTELRNAAIDLAERLARSEDAAERGVGRDALRDLRKPS